MVFRTEIHTDERGGATPGLRSGALALLVVVTAVGASGLAAGGSAGGLLAADDTGTDAAAGLPLGLLVLGSGGAAIAIARLTPRVGRGPSLALGYLVGTVGAGVVILAAATSSFAGLLFGSGLLGGANAAVFLSRYAAVALVPAARGRALGAVFAGTAAGAVTSASLLGPSGGLAGTIGLPTDSGLYLIALCVFVVAALALLLTRRSGFRTSGHDAGSDLRRRRDSDTVDWRELRAGLLTIQARIAVTTLAVANFVMVGVMAVAPIHLAMSGMTLRIVGVVVAVHVAGMFAPAPISGWLADRIGGESVAAIGAVMLVAAGLAGAHFASGPTGAIASVLLFLGLGWNFSVVGGSVLLADAVGPGLRPHIEGIGEVAMSFAAAVGAPLAGLIMNLSGFAGLWLTGAGVAAASFIFVRLARLGTSSPA